MNIDPFSGKKAISAALLLHGFPGTPAEMRPLGTVLRDAGWTVHGLMLPGLGADIASLEERNFQDWSDAARERHGRTEAAALGESFWSATPWAAPWHCTQRWNSGRRTGSTRAVLEFRRRLVEDVVAGRKIALSPRQTTEARRFLRYGGPPRAAADV